MIRKIVFWIALFIVEFVSAVSPVKSQQSYIDSLIQVVDKQKDDTAKINNLMHLVYKLVYNDVLKARKYNHQILKLSKELNYTRGLVDYYHNNARININIKDNDSAYYYLDSAIVYARKLNNDSKMAVLYKAYAIVLRNDGFYKSAMDYFNRSIQLFRKNNEISNISEVYNSIGILFFRKSDFDTAAYYYLKSLKISDSLDRKLNIANAKLNLGKVFFMLKEYYRAQKYFTECLDLYRKLDNTIFEALALENLGGTYVKLKDYDSAIYYFNKTMKKYDEMNQTSLKANVLMNIGGVYLDLGEYNKAMDYYNQSMSIQKRNGNYPGIMDVLTNIALVNERKSNYNLALKYYDTCLTYARKFKMRDRIAHLYENIYLLYGLAGNYKMAYEYQSKFLKLNDSIFNAERAIAIEDIERRYQTKKKESQLLVAENQVLESQLTVKKRTNERNLIAIISIAVIIIVALLLILQVYKSRKNKIIREKEIARLKEEKRAVMARSLVEGQEEERKRIARELHDGLGVLLSTAKIQFSNYVDRNPENRDLLDRAAVALDRASTDIRRISHNMMPSVVLKYGLYEAIEDLFDEINESNNIKAVAEIKGEKKRLPENDEIMLYRIFQELLNNTLKHAEATEISLIIEIVDNHLRIQYSDNGKGFDSENFLKKDSIGMKSIQSRVGYLNGELDIDTAPGKGSSFFIMIPLNERQTSN